MSIVLTGVDNSGIPRQKFAEHIALLPDEDFVEEAKNKIWLSAFANNNARSDYHWQADACFNEADRRGNPDLYVAAWNKASSS